jgi:hypothetical protein
MLALSNRTNTTVNSISTTITSMPIITSTIASNNNTATFSKTSDFNIITYTTFKNHVSSNQNDLLSNLNVNFNINDFFSTLISNQFNEESITKFLTQSNNDKEINKSISNNNNDINNSYENENDENENKIKLDDSTLIKNINQENLSLLLNHDGYNFLSTNSFITSTPSNISTSIITTDDTTSKTTTTTTITSTTISTTIIYNNIIYKYPSVITTTKNSFLNTYDANFPSPLLKFPSAHNENIFPDSNSLLTLTNTKILKNTLNNNDKTYIKDTTSFLATNSNDLINNYYETSTILNDNELQQANDESQPILIDKFHDQVYPHQPLASTSTLIMSTLIQETTNTSANILKTNSFPIDTNTTKLTKFISRFNTLYTSDKIENISTENEIILKNQKNSQNTIIMAETQPQEFTELEIADNKPTIIYSNLNNIKVKYKSFKGNINIIS